MREQLPPLNTPLTTDCSFMQIADVYLENVVYALCYEIVILCWLEFKDQKV